jgi:hypothetical protein
MDGYLMSVAHMLVDATAGHKVISFMDGNAGYNQIFMAEEDIHKTAFRCPGALGLYEWVVMTFGLKNASATYQRAMKKELKLARKVLVPSTKQYHPLPRLSYNL